MGGLNAEQIHNTDRYAMRTHRKNGTECEIHQPRIQSSDMSISLNVILIMKEVVTSLLW